jgi:hypothetical protein
MLIQDTLTWLLSLDCDPITFEDVTMGPELKGEN